MKRKKERIKLYMETGLAVLLVIALAAGGRAGLFEKAVNAAEELTGAVQEDTGSAEEEKGIESGSGEETSASDASAGAEETIADGQYPIPAEALSQGGADSIETFCQMYYDEACAEGVRPEVAFAQTMKETGFLQYGGDASIEQFNFAGLGTTGGGVPGNSYPDVRTGIRAQIQHLKAYATTDALAQECVDDRYEYVKKGSAPYVEWLGQQENPEGVGWATGDNYGYDIVSMIREMRGE